MKKLTALLLALAMSMAFVACGNEAAPSEEAPEAPAFENAEAVLNEIIKEYPEDQAFPMMGGFGETPVENAAGAFPLEDAALVENILSVPEAALENVDAAANLMHMMNGNMFTSAALHLKDAAAAEAFVTSVKENVLSKQWLCGAPEKLLIANVGDYVVVTYGAGDIVDTYKAQITKNIPSASIAVEEAIGA